MTEVPPIFKWMPFDLARFLQETSALNDTEQMALLRLRYHHWIVGWLPSEPARLANIANIPVDAWSITWSSLQAYVEHAFLKGADGHLHHLVDGEKRQIFLEKSLRAKEKARKAAAARWSKHKAKTDAPSIPQADARADARAMPINREIEEQQQKQPPPTPSAARRGTDAPSMLEQPNAPSMTAQARPMSAAIADQNVSKAKPTDFAPGAVQNGVDRESGHHGANGTRPRQVKPLPGHQKKPVQPADADPRRSPFREEVRKFWQGQNPELDLYEFKAADEKALSDLLEQNPKMTLRMLQACLHNRADSEINPAAAPAKWLRGVAEYVAHPLDRYQKPLKRARVF